MRITRRLSSVFFLLIGLVAAAPFVAREDAAAQMVHGADQVPEADSTTSPPPVGPRDPFIPLVCKGGPAQQRPTLSGLRLAGLIWDSSAEEQIRALVETADGLGYILRVGDQRFRGKVVVIGRDRLRFSVVDQTAGQSRVQLLDLRLEGGEPTIVRTSSSP
jgi:hypothetical protein